MVEAVILHCLENDASARPSSALAGLKLEMSEDSETEGELDADGTRTWLYKELYPRPAGDR